MTAADLPPCTECGACCVAYGAAVAVELHDRTPRHLTRSVRGVVGFDITEIEAGTRRMATNSAGRCVALRGEVGQACQCAIYDRRPDVCQAFPRGSADCLQARKFILKGIAA